MQQRGQFPVYIRGFGVDEMRALGRIIQEALAGRDDPAVAERLIGEVAAIAGRFPVPGLPDEAA